MQVDGCGWIVHRYGIQLWDRNTTEILFSVHTPSSIVHGALAGAGSFSPIQCSQILSEQVSITSGHEKKAWSSPMLDKYMVYHIPNMVMI